MGSRVLKGTLWLLAAVLIFGAGCDRHIESNDSHPFSTG